MANTLVGLSTNRGQLQELGSAVHFPVILRNLQDVFPYRQTSSPYAGICQRLKVLLKVAYFSNVRPVFPLENGGFDVRWVRFPSPAPPPFCPCIAGIT